MNAAEGECWIGGLMMDVMKMPTGLMKLSLYQLGFGLDGPDALM